MRMLIVVIFEGAEHPNLMVVDSESVDQLTVEHDELPAHAPAPPVPMAMAKVPAEVSEKV